jgi:hypothetical protein
MDRAHHHLHCLPPSASTFFILDVAYVARRRWINRLLPSPPTVDTVAPPRRPKLAEQSSLPIRLPPCPHSNSSLFHFWGAHPRAPPVKAATRHERPCRLIRWSGTFLASLAMLGPATSSLSAVAVYNLSSLWPTTLTLRLSSSFSYRRRRPPLP